jgi:hypothetical protein
MRKKLLLIMLVALGVTSMISCDKEDLFDQPTINVIGFTLDGLPGEYTTLNVDVEVINNDSKEATIKDAEYNVVVEGFVCEKESVDIGQKIYNDVPLELSLPLTLKTTDAIQLLTKLDSGKELSYTVVGTFHLDKAVLDAIDLPIDIEGTAFVDVGFDDFFEQPEVTVNDMDGTYVINGLTSYVFNFDVNCDVKNIDTRDAIVDEVEYTVIVEGVESNTHLYSDTYSSSIDIAGGATVDMILPVTLNLGLTDGIALAAAMADGTVSYTIEGTFHVIEVDGSTEDFLLPLYVTGSVPSTMVLGK